MKKIYLFIALFVTVNFLQAQGVGGAVTVIAGGKVVKDIIREFEQSAQSLLANAQGSGNFLVGRVGNELTVAAQNASILFGDKLNKTYQELNEKERSFLGQIESFRLSLDNVTGKAFELEDQLAFDLRQVVDETIFAKKTNFYVQGIQGINALYSNQDYVIRITGVGFGFDSDHFRSKIVSVSTKNAGGSINLKFIENKVHAGVSSIVINQTDLNNIITDNNSQQQFELSVNVKVEREKGFWFFKHWVDYDFKVKFAFSIFPTKTKLRISYSTPTLGWKKISTASPYQYTTANHDQHDAGHNNIRNFYYDPTLAQLPINQHFVNSSYIKREGDGCPWTDRSQATIIEATDGGTKLVAHLKTWGLPCTYYFQSDIEQYDVTGSAIQPPIEVTVEYGGLLTFKLPKSVTAYEVFGSTLNNMPIHILNNGNYRTFITFDTSVDDNDGVNKIYSFKVGMPF